MCVTDRRVAVNQTAKKMFGGDSYGAWIVIGQWRESLHRGN